MDLTELRDEIVNDPQGIGLKEAGEWKGDQVIADLLNDPANGATITRKRIEPGELRASMDLGEYLNLTDGQRAYLAMLLGGVVDATEAPVLSALTTIFAAGSATRTSLLAKIQRPGSRAEILWGEGTVVGPGVGGVGAASNLIGA